MHRSSPERRFEIPKVVFFFHLHACVVWVLRVYSNENVRRIKAEVMFSVMPDVGGAVSRSTSPSSVENFKLK